MKKFLILILISFLASIQFSNKKIENIYFVGSGEIIPIDGSNEHFYSDENQIGTLLTYEINYDFDPVKTLLYLEDKYDGVTDLNVYKIQYEYQMILVNCFFSIKSEIKQDLNIDIPEDSLYSPFPYITFVIDDIINEVSQLNSDYKKMANHPLINNLIISPLFSRPPIEIEDPGGGGEPDNDYDMYYIKQTVNDSLMYTGDNVKVGILESRNNDDYFMVNPAIEYFKTDQVRHDPNVNFTSYLPHPTTVAGISSGHYGIAKNSLVYSTSFNQITPTGYRVNQALLWLVKQSNINYENINVDVINMSFAGPGEVNDIRTFSYNNRKIIIAGVGNHFLDSIGYPASYANVFTVGATTPSGNELWQNSDNPIEGSAYLNNSNGINKPNIVAPGMISFMNLPENSNFAQGTSFSTPVVTGAVAKLIEASPQLRLSPELVYALLMATANQDIVSSINQAYNLNIGYKTGSGMLDITKLIHNRNNTKKVFSSDFINNKYTFDIFVDNPTYANKNISISAFWFEKKENSTYKLSNYDLSVNVNGNIFFSNSNTNNYELLKFSTNLHGNITVTIDQINFKGNNSDLIGLAWTFY